MKALGFKSCRADPDVWYRAKTKPTSGYKYYAYVLLYIDDILAIHHNAMQCLYFINKYFTIKTESMGDPDLYLGAKMRKVCMDNGVEAWAMSPAKYVKEAVLLVKERLAKDGN